MLIRDNKNVGEVHGRRVGTLTGGEMALEGKYHKEIDVLSKTGKRCMDYLEVSGPAGATGGVTSANVRGSADAADPVHCCAAVQRPKVVASSAARLLLCASKVCLRVGGEGSCLWIAQFVSSNPENLPE